MNTKEVAYILGALHDGYLYERDYLISISQKDEKWLEYLQILFMKNFGVSGKIRKFRNAFELRVFSKMVFLEFQEHTKYPIPRIVEDDKYLWTSYISGFFDAEGHCTKPKTFMKTKKKKIQFHQNNKEKLEFIKKVLESYGIVVGKIYLDKGRRCHAIYIQSKNGIIKFANNFELIRKKDDMENLISVLLPDRHQSGFLPKCITVQPCL